MKLIWTETVRQFNVSFHALLECLQISLQLAYAIHSVCRVNLSGFTCHRVQASRFLCTICSYVTTRQKFVTVLSLVMLQAKVYSDPFCARQHICQARYVLSQFCTSVWIFSEFTYVLRDIFGHRAVIKHLQQQSRAVAREPRDATAVVFGSSPTTFTTSLTVAKLRKPGFRTPNIPRKTEFNAKWPFYVTCFLETVERW